MERNKFLVLMVCGLILPVQAWAATPSSPKENATLAYLRSTVGTVLQSNSELQAAIANVESIKLQAEGAGLPLYNPEIGVEAESATEDTYTLGVSQTFDWHDKQIGHKSALDILLQKAEAQQSYLVMRLANDVLTAMTDFYSEIAIADLHKQSIALLEKVVGLTEQRLAAGDINKTEVLLARIALADAVIAQANQGSKVIEAQNNYSKLSQGILEDKIFFYLTLPSNVSEDQDLDILASQHPLEKIALLDIEHARRQVNAEQRDRMADPTINLVLGKEGEESLVGLQFSMPWQIRNDFSYKVDVARKEQLRVEFQAQNTHRQVLADIRAALAQYQLKASAWKIWQTSGENQLQEHIRLLEQFWKSGDLSTTEYLIQLEQNLRTEISGAELRGDMWRAWFQWLGATGRILSWLEFDVQNVLEGEQ
ncbi:MAG TPA: TolC family protein [Gammaproteobacteria bacterium]